MSARGSLPLIYLTIQCYAFSVKLTSSQHKLKEVSQAEDAKKKKNEPAGGGRPRRRTRRRRRQEAAQISPPREGRRRDGVEQGVRVADRGDREAHLQHRRQQIRRPVYGIAREGRGVYPTGGNGRELPRRRDNQDRESADDRTATPRRRGRPRQGGPGRDPRRSREVSRKEATETRRIPQKGICHRLRSMFARGTRQVEGDQGLGRGAVGAVAPRTHQENRENLCGV